MKNVTVTGWVCALSLAANVAGISAWMLASRGGAPEQVAAVETLAEAKLKGGLSSETRRLLAETGVENLEALRDRLRAEGFSGELVREVVEQRLWKDMRAKLDAVDPAKRRPWWQRTARDIPGDRVRMEKLRAKIEAELEMRKKHLFPDAEPASDDEDDSVRLAFLPAGKREALRALEKDYREMNERADVESAGVLLWSDREKRDVLRRELEKDRADLMSPEEFAEWTLRDPYKAPREKICAALLNLSEDKFRRLVEISTNRNSALEAASSEVQADEVNRLADSQIQAVLGSDGMLVYDNLFEGGVVYAADYVARFDLPETRVVDYLKFEKRVFEELRASSEKPLGEDAAYTARLMKWLSTTKNELVRLMGPHALDSKLGVVRVLLEMGGVEERGRAAPVIE